MNEYNIIAINGCTSICCNCDSFRNSFIDIYSEDKNTPSPFRDDEDAVLFAEILVRLLEAIHNDSER